MLEQTQTIAELQSRVQSLSVDHDRRLTAIQQCHEDEKQVLLAQLQQTVEQMKDLEKDLYYYKHKNRELRKSITTTNDKDAQPHHSNTSFRLQTVKRSTSSHQS
jgi:chromosome segregation ATPase